MSASAGIVVTGTEVLTGHVRDANGPWLAERLREHGVEIGQILVVGDRPDDLARAIEFLAGTNDLVITSGGLGPTADDLTAEVVGRVQGRALALDPALQRRIAVLVQEWADRRGWSGVSQDLAQGVAKQSLVPTGSHVLEPTGTAPGLVVPPTSEGPPVLVLPGPPRELQTMWPAALADPFVIAALAGREELRESMVRIWGRAEAELAGLLRQHEDTHDLSPIEVTTCARDGELEVAGRYRAAEEPTWQSLVAALMQHFGADAYSTEGAAIDEFVAAALRSNQATVATAESCTAGLLAGRLADLSGSSDYLLGGFVTYSNESKTESVGVPAELISRVGAVSEEVARTMADGARRRLGATYGIGITGIAGPGGGTADKPVGLVHLALAGPDRQWHRRLDLDGDRQSVRRRTVVIALHLLREALASASA